jgi:hypothetical protein
MRKFHGKENLIASLNYWLTHTIQGGHIGIPPLPAGKEFYWLFDFPIAPLTTPAISITEIGLFNYGEIAFDRLIGFDGDDPIYGTKNQTLIEIVCTDQDSADYSAATNKVRNFRDRVIDALSVSRIPLVDYGHPDKPQIGYLWVDNNSNAINEKLLVDPQNQNLKRYVLLVRIFWLELSQRTKFKTIKTDAEIV